MSRLPNADKLAFTVIPLAAPLRLDLYLHQLFPHASRRDCAALFDNKAILLNGRIAKKSERVSGREEIALLPEATAIYSLHALSSNPSIPIRLCYEDDDLFAIDKPAGIDTLPQRFTDTATLGNAILTRWPNLIKVGRSPFDCGFLHRLDRYTSGLVLGAKRREIWYRLHASMRVGAIEKGYLAWVEGTPTQDCGEIRFALESRSKHSERTRVNLDQEGAYVTRWKVVKRDILLPSLEGTGHGDGENSTLLATIITRGARHQIRAHLAAMDHPIVGDTLYGGSACTGLSRYFLHAHRLHFRHPVHNKAIVIDCPLPYELERVLTHCRRGKHVERH